MPPIALGTKHQDLLKAYFEVSKTSSADWISIASNADYPTAKYARDQFTIVRSKLLATAIGDPINLSDRQIALLKSAIEVMKAETDWEKVASFAKVKTPKYARDQWTIVKTKLCGGKGTAASGSPAKTPAKSKTTPSRKRKDREETGDVKQGSASADEAPKTKSKTKKKARKAKAEDELATPTLQEQADADVKLELQDDFEDARFEAEMFQME